MQASPLQTIEPASPVRRPNLRKSIDCSKMFSRLIWHKLWQFMPFKAGQRLYISIKIERRSIEITGWVKDQHKRFFRIRISTFSINIRVRIIIHGFMNTLYELYIDGLTSRWRGSRRRRQVAPPARSTRTQSTSQFLGRQIY